MITMSYSSVEAFLAMRDFKMTKKLAQLGIHVFVVGRNVERGRRQSTKFTLVEEGLISFPPIFGTQPALARWQRERSNLEVAMSIFSSTTPAPILSDLRMK